MHWLHCFPAVSVSGTGNIVAIMIPEPKGREILALLERNIKITLHITIGTRNLQKYVSRTSVVFVSISFIVLMIISLAWLVFYYIQRFRYANARDRNQVWLCSCCPSTTLWAVLHSGYQQRCCAELSLFQIVSHCICLSVRLWGLTAGRAEKWQTSKPSTSWGLWPSKPTV